MRRGVYLLLTSIILVIVIFLTFVSFTSVSKASNTEAKVDDRIIEELQSNDRISVIVNLKETENSEVSLNSLDKSYKIEKRKEEVKNNQDKVLDKIENSKQKNVVVNNENNNSNDNQNNNQESNFKLKHRYSVINSLYVEVDKDALEELKTLPEVDSISYDEILHINLNDSVPLINATEVGTYNYKGINITGTGETVCVLDTGINYSLSHLGGCTTSQFTSGACSKVVGGYDYASTPDDNDPYDDHNHGTQVSTIIAGNDSTYKGVAPGANIFAVKVCNSAGSCATSDITSGIDLCIANKTAYNISVISMSLGTDTNFSSDCDTDTLASSANSGDDNGIIVVASAGNNGASQVGLASPACGSKVISVGSTTKTNTISSFSQYGTILDLLAPGDDIITSNRAGTFSAVDGTSFSAPHVSGAIALLMQTRRAINSTLNRTQIINAFNQTGLQINDTRNGLFYPRINVSATYINLHPPSITFVSPTPSNNSVTTSNSIFVNITTNENISVALISVANINYTMNNSGSGFNWFFNFTNATSQNTYVIYANDSDNKIGVSETRTFTLNNTAPNITSNTPSNTNVVNFAEPNNQTFSITFNDLDNNTLNITWYFDSQVFLSNFSNSTFANYTLVGNYTQNGTHTVNVTVNDTLSSATLSWNLTINNTNGPPEISATSPSSSTPSIAEPNDQAFSLTVSDPDNDNINYTWYKDGVNQTNATSYTFAGGYSTSGTYNITITLTDSNYNVSNEWTLTVTDTTQNSGGSGGGGGGGGSSSKKKTITTQTQEQTKTELPSDVVRSGSSSRVDLPEIKETGDSLEQLEVVEVKLQNKAKINFEVTPSSKNNSWEKEEHSVTVDAISKDSVNLTVQSTPQTFELKEKESRDVDFDEDSIYDLRVTLNKINITLNYTDISLSPIRQEIVTIHEVEYVTEEIPKRSLVSFIGGVFGIVVILLVILIVTILIARRKRRK